jgi:glycosyltransferase involved in cell wall biosynthesis
MKIAFIEPHLELYGGIRRIMELSNRLTTLGEDVTLFHPSGERCQWMEGLAPTRPLSDLYNEKFDVVIFNDPPDYKIARRAKADLKVFYILCLYEREKLKNFNPKIFWIRKGRTLSTQRALQLPFLRIANATWMQRFLIDELGLDALLLIGGVNHDIFHPVEVPRRESACRILCTGDPRERKGTDTIKAAFAIVQKRFPDAVLDTYHGQGISQERMAEKYASADLFVDAQDYGGWNNPVAEAMACGVPVVCTDIGAVADFAHHERTALLTPVADAEALAAAMIRMMDDSGLRERLKLNGLDKIAEFDWDRAALGMQKILQESLVARATR